MIAPPFICKIVPVMYWAFPGFVDSAICYSLIE